MVFVPQSTVLILSEPNIKLFLKLCRCVTSLNKSSIIFGDNLFVTKDHG